MIALLEHPGAGILLGVCVALALFGLSRASFRRITPEAAVEGLVYVSLALLARLAFVTVALWAYRHFVPSGFPPFALSLAGGFVVLYTVELVRYAGLHRLTRPAGRP